MKHKKDISPEARKALKSYQNNLIGHVNQELPYLYQLLGYTSEPKANNMEEAISTIKDLYERTKDIQDD
jgi:hypothetical protein